MGYSMGFIQMGRFSSQTVGPVIGGVLAAFLGFRETFFFTSILYFAAFLVVVFVVKEDFQRPPRAEGELSLRRAPWAVIGRDIAAIAAIPALVLMMVILYFLFASNAFVRPVVPLVLQDIGDQENVELIAGLVFATLAITSAVSSIMIGRLANSVGYRVALTVSVVGAGLVYLPVVFVDTAWQLAMLMGLVGIFSGGMLAVTNALIGALSPAGKQGSAFGVASSSQALAMATGPLAGGLAASALGVRAGFPIVSVILIAVGVVAWFAIKEPESAEAAQPAGETVVRT
jgi:MFS family permease